MSAPILVASDEKGVCGGALVVIMAREGTRLSCICTHHSGSLLCWTKAHGQEGEQTCWVKGEKHVQNTRWELCGGVREPSVPLVL